jgi:glycosyltransferase involved in cell wall biosynthesis
MSLMKVSLFIPTRNEIVGVKEIMPRIKKDWVDEIVIIDGDSTDGTYEYLKENGYNVIKQKEKGTIRAWWQGFQETTGDVIVMFSPDGNSIPELIPELVQKIREGNDMVVASRYLGNAKSDDDTVLTGFGNWLFVFLTNFLMRSKYTEVLVILRAFRKDLLDELGFNEDSGARFNKKKVSMFEILLCLRCARMKKKTAEISGDEPPRIDGKGSVIFPKPIDRFYAGFAMLYCIFAEWTKKVLCISLKKV